MKIGIEARLYSQTGVGRYLKNLIWELGRLDKENEYIVYLRSQEFSSFRPPSSAWKKKLIDIPWHTVSEQIRLPQILLKDNLDLVHFPYFNIPVLYPKKFVMTIHDLIVDHFDTGRASTLPYPVYKLKRIGYRTSLKLGLTRASAIFAISKTTKQEIVDHYRIDPEKIVVTYDALDERFKQIGFKQKPINYYSFPYILYVGNAYPHKNLECLLEAFFVLIKTKKVKLVMAGDDNYFYPRLKGYAEKLGLSNNVIFFGEADDEQLINLYSNCLFLVFPSLMEGFGLPNFEALFCERLPVVSDIPVFHELWGDTLSYFNPKRRESIVRSLLNVLSYKKNDYKRRVKEARGKVERFNWKNTASDTLKIYKQVRVS